MKLYWFLVEWIADSLLAFSLVLNAAVVFDLFSAGMPSHLDIRLLLIPVELICGYSYTDRFVQKWRKRKLRKSVLMQDAIAFVSQQPGQTRRRATELVLSLCENLPPESREPILRGICNCSMPSISEINEYKNCIGDVRCINNARSPYLRCAIAPTRESCEGCQHYTKRQ